METESFMNTWPTVVITSYNKGQRLFRALESLAEQTILEFYVVVVDDCSNDELSIETLNRAVVHPWPFTVTFIKNNRNEGASFSKNKGINSANTDLIILLDADDTLPITAIKEIACTAKKHPNYDFYFGDYYNGFSIIDCSELCDKGGSELSPANLCKKWILLGSSPFWKSKWGEIGGFDERNPKSDDFELYKKWIVAGAKGRYINSIIYNWFPDQDGNQASNSSVDRAMAFFRTWNFDWKFSKPLFFYRLIKSIYLIVKK